MSAPALLYKHAAETIPESGGGKIRRDAGFIDDVHVGALLDQQLQHPVPAAVTRTEERILVVGGDGFRIDSEVEQKLDGLERPILVVDDFADASIETGCREDRIGVGLRHEMRIRAGSEQNAHHLDVRGIGCDDERRRADGVVVAARPRSGESWRADRHLKIRVRAVRQQSFDELQFGVAIRNTADRIDEPVDRIRQSVFPRARCPVEGSEPGIENVGIRPAIQQEQRER